MIYIVMRKLSRGKGMREDGKDDEMGEEGILAFDHGNSH